MSWANISSRAKQQGVQKDVGVAGTVTVAPFVLWQQECSTENNSDIKYIYSPIAFFFLCVISYGYLQGSENSEREACK